MQVWLPFTLWTLLALLLLVGPLGLLAGRRRWLARQGGTFECSVRLADPVSQTPRPAQPPRAQTPRPGWVLGTARYNEERFEWFRFYSFALRPRLSLRRAGIRVVGGRIPEASEAVALYADQRVVVVEEHSPDGVQEWELAMNPDSLTGLLSWLEAAPPGLGR